jgi:two-component system CheB/CheR fusion protein
MSALVNRTLLSALDEDLGVLDAVAGAHASQNGARELAGHDERVVDGGRGAAARATRLRAAAFQAAGTAQLLLDSNGVLVAANDLARRQFGLTASDLDRPVQELALLACPVKLAEQLDRARRSGAVDLPLVRWPTTNGERLLNVRIATLTRQGDVLGSSITFTDVTARHEPERQLSDTRCGLADVCEQLRSVAEQFEIKLEELRSLGELLDSANHDLLTATERLERLSHDLRSIDHERTLLREELHRREAERIVDTAMLTTILDTVDLPVMGLDQEQLVQMWNRRSSEISGKTNEDAHRNGRLEIGLHAAHLAMGNGNTLDAPADRETGNGSLLTRSEPGTRSAALAEEDAARQDRAGPRSRG